MGLGGVGEPAVELGGRDPRAPGRREAADQAEHTIGTGAGEGREPHDRRVCREAEGAGRLVTYPRRRLFAVDRVPFVEYEAGRAAPLSRLAHDVNVAIRDALLRVCQHQHDFGAFHRPQCEERTHPLSHAIPARPAPQTRGVDEFEDFAVDFDAGVDGVSGRPPFGRHHRPLGTDQAVEERTLADVRSADERDPVVGRGRRLALPFRQLFHEGFERLPGAGPVLRRHGPGAFEAQPIELVDAVFVRGAVDLVHEQRDGRPRAAEFARDLFVLREEPRLRIDEKEHRVGLIDRDARLLLHGSFQFSGGVGVEPGGIDQQHRAVPHLHHTVYPVAGDTRSILDDRPARARVAVEQRRLADVRSADDRNHRQRTTHRDLAPSRNAATRPSIAARSSGWNQIASGTARNQVRWRRANRRVSAAICCSA